MHLALSIRLLQAVPTRISRLQVKSLHGEMHLRRSLKFSKRRMNIHTRTLRAPASLVLGIETKRGSKRQ